MKRYIAVAMALALLLGLLSGCGRQGEYVPTGNGLTEQEATRPTEPVVPSVQELSLTYYPEKGLNPYTCTDENNRLLFSLLYQSLFTVSRDYVTEPQLCRGYWRSDDMMRYVFYPENATFSDGTALSVADVLASLEAARTSPIYSGRFSRVESIVPTQDGGLQINLTIPYENFPMLLDVPIVKASQVGADTPVGTGPYILERGLTGPWLRLRRDWWCKADLPLTAEKIPLLTATSATGIRDQFERENVGVACANPGASSYVDFRCDYELWDCENGIFLYLGCNSKSAVFGSAAVRQALTYAIDRKTISLQFYRSFAQSATLPASPGSPYYNQAEASKYQYDADRFVRILEAEGVAGSTVSLLVNKDDGRRLQVAQAIGSMLEDCGLKVTLRSLGGDEYLAALKSGRFDLHLGQTKLSPNMDLSAFYSTDGTLNFGGMADAGIYSLCQDALANQGNYAGLHQAVLQDAMLCPVAFLSYAVYAQRGLMDNFAPARDCIFYYSLGKTMSDIQIIE